jgi:hypothetical protein
MRKFNMLPVYFVLLSFTAVSYYMAGHNSIALKSNLNVAHKSYITGCIESGFLTASVCREKNDLYRKELTKVLDAAN